MKNYSYELKNECKRLFEEMSAESSPRRLASFILWQVQETEYFRQYGKPSKVNKEILPQTFYIERIEGVESDPTLEFLLKFYKTNESNSYILDETIEMSSTEYDTICEKFIFIQGRVVMVNFGFSFGKELGEIRPALILGEAGPGEIFVLPLTKDDVSDENPKYANIEVLCSDPDSCLVAHIDELKRISVNRIITSHEFGGIDNETLQYVLDRFAKYYGNLFKVD